MPQIYERQNAPRECALAERFCDCTRGVVASTALLCYNLFQFPDKINNLLGGDS